MTSLHWEVAQPVEPLAVNESDAGSNPALPAKLMDPYSEEYGEWVDDHPDGWRSSCDDEWASYTNDTDPDSTDPRWFRENYT